LSAKISLEFNCVIEQVAPLMPSKYSFQIAPCLMLILLVACSTFRAAAHEEQEMIVGASAAGQIKVDEDFLQPFGVPASIFPGFPGYASGEIAFHSTVLDEPTNDFFQLTNNGDFRFVLIAKDPGIEIWNGQSYMTIGESFFIGPAAFDVHPIWNIVGGSPGQEYSLTLKIYDTNGVYSESEPLVLTFVSEAAHGPFAMNIKLDDPFHGAISWSTNAVGWVPQSADSLTTAGWDTITNTPGIIGTNFSLSIPTTGTQQFFRLLKL
jgi:hypothetical protein